MGSWWNWIYWSHYSDPFDGVEYMYLVDELVWQEGKDWLKILHYYCMKKKFSILNSNVTVGPKLPSPMQEFSLITSPTRDSLFAIFHATKYLSNWWRFLDNTWTEIGNSKRWLCFNVCSRWVSFIEKEIVIRIFMFYLKWENKT